MAVVTPTPCPCRGHLLGSQTRPVTKTQVPMDGLAAHPAPRWCIGQGGDRQLTPQVVITGSLNTLQHSWQHSFTESCSANTSGS